MQHIIDCRFGTQGKALWFYLFRPFVLILVIIFIANAVLNLGISHGFPVLAVLILSGLFVIYLLLDNILLLREAPRVARCIQFNGKTKVCLFFGRQIQFSVSEVSRVDLHRVRSWIRMSTLLDSDRPNYLITLKDGSWFYVSGSIDGVEGFIRKLSTELDEEIA